jgi:hypothetical protein
MRWLLDFVQKDLANLREGERQDLELDAYLFRSSGAALDVVPSREPVSLGVLHADLRAGIDLLLDGQPWELPATPSGWTLATDMPGQTIDDTGEAHRDVQPLGRVYIGTAREAFLARATDLLVLFWPRLRQCDYAQCGALTLRRRQRSLRRAGAAGKPARGSYCSSEHSRLARWERFKAGRTRDYAKEYMLRLGREGRRPPHRRQAARRAK